MIVGRMQIKFMDHHSKISYFQGAEKGLRSPTGRYNQEIGAREQRMLKIPTPRISYTVYVLYNNLV